MYGGQRPRDISLQILCRRLKEPQKAKKRSALRLKCRTLWKFNNYGHSEILCYNKMMKTRGDCIPTAYTSKKAIYQPHMHSSGNSLPAYLPEKMAKSVYQEIVNTYISCRNNGNKGSGNRFIVVNTGVITYKYSYVAIRSLEAISLNLNSL